jgi:TPR repeat protein
MTRRGRVFGPLNALGVFAGVLCCLAVFAAGGARAAEEPSWPDLSRVQKVGGGENDTVLIAAVERYLLLPSVPGARANAEAWFDYFTKGRGVPVDRVHLLRDAQVTTGKLRRFAAKAAAAALEGGTLWFVFIGHGAPSKDGKSGVLVGADAQQDADNLFERSVPRTELLEILERSRAARVVAVIDACFSGRAAGGKPLVPGLQPLVVVRDAPAAGPRTIVMSAGKSNEFAGPLPGAARPAFSYLVLGGLRGWAGAQSGARVTATDLVAYAAKVLRSLVQDRSQTPTAEGGLLLGEPLGGGSETGPDLAALVKRYGDTAIEAQRAELPRVPDLPAALSSGVSLGADVDVLVAYDRAMKAERVDDPRAKSAAWKVVAALGGKNPYREDAARRASAWEELARKREELEKVANEEWAKLEKLLPLDVLGEEQKTRLAAAFAARFGSLPNARKRIETLGGLHARAAAVYSRACEAGADWACAHLGHLYWNGIGVAKDVVRAVELWKPTCERGEAWACHGMGAAFEHGVAGIAKDDARAAAHYQRGCDGNAYWSCSSLGHYYWAGRGVPRDDDRALVLWKKACDGALEHGCASLGHAYWNGRGVAKDDAKAFALWKKACDSGEAFGCTSVAHAFWNGRGVAKDEAKAFALWKKACDASDMAACTLVGQAYWEGRGVPQDDAMAFTTWKPACDAGDLGACASLGHLYWSGRGVAKDEARAVALWKRVCDAGHLHGCSGVGLGHHMGAGIAKDHAAAVAIWQKTCGAGELWGCHSLGFMYRGGFGVPKDEARAKTFFRKACDGGFTPACPFINP